ncbi:MAG: SMC family ATPase [Methanomicrobiales archaeon]|nr:SMC family ATPase [Methanomicrobiales archaeon]
MQLLKLQMRNFKRYRSQDVAFRDGITGILGNNGTGKSTIVDAILFCLYGVKETGLEYILSANADRRAKAVVKLDFTVRGEEFQLLRCLGPGKKHDVELYRGKKLLAKGVSEVHDALRKVIRMGHTDFRHTIFSGQRELLTLVDATPEERKKWFRRVLGLDRLRDRGGDILREEVRVARDLALQVKGRMEGVDEEDLLKKMEENESGRAQAEVERRKLGEEERALGKAILSLEKDEKALRERENKSMSIQALIRAKDEEAAGVERELGENRRELAALGTREEEWRTVSAHESLFESKKENYSAGRELARGYQDLMIREGEKRERLNECERDLARFREDASRLDRDEELVRALAPAIARCSGLQSRLEELGGLEERDRELSVRIDQKEGALKLSKRQGRELLSRIEKLKKEKERLRAIASGAGVPPDDLEEPLGYLDGRRRDLIRIIADATAARGEAIRRKEGLSKDLATLEASGPEGACPTCRQTLGLHYQDLVSGLRQGIDTEAETVLRMSEQIRVAEGEIASLEDHLGEVKKLLDMTSPLGDLTARWEEVQERSLQDISEKEGLERERAALGYDARERKESERELASLKKQWEEHLAAVERLKNRPALARTIEDLEKRRERLAGEIATLTCDRDTLGFDPAAHEVLKQEFEAAERNHARYLELKSLLDHIPMLRRQGEVLGTRAAAIRQVLGQLKAELQGVAFSPGDLGRVERDLQAVRQDLLRSGQHRERCLAGMAHLEEERERLAAILGRQGDDRKEYNRLTEEIRMLELTRDQLNGFTDHLLGVVRDQIQDETGRILSEITDGRYDTILLGDNFELLVHDLGGDYPVSRFSGGEQDDVAIALRIALSRYIAEMHELHDSTFLIFDEIFGSQDEERRGNILRALRTLEPFFSQIFLISHVSEVQGEFGNTLVVEAVSGSESRIRDLEEAPA